MKIMDLSSEDGESQVEAVVNSKTKNSKQARLPFQTLTTDSPVVNKKRKHLSSPDCRNAKQAKVNTKENSFIVSKKNETDDIIVIDEKSADEQEEIKTNESDGKDSTKTAPVESIDTKNKKSTPGKGPGKLKKSDKIQTNPLTKFFKVIDNKHNIDIKNEQSTKTKKEDTEQAKNINNNTDHIVEKSDEQKKDEIIKSKEVDIDEKDNNSNESENSDEEESSDENEKSQANISILNDSKIMDVDSDMIGSDNSEDDDSEKSDTDSKKTEHEDTDSKDDMNRSNGVKVLTPTTNKLLDSSSKSKKLTPKQIERKLEIQKKREHREKQRLEREKKLQEERESRKKEKEEKKREREEKEKALKEQKKKEKELKELKKQAEIELKQKEKEAKEEDRRKREEAKEEEKRRKEEERLEAERKKLKAASNFVSFFVAKKPTETKVVEEEKKVIARNFMPFEIKADMRVAPQVRRHLTTIEKSKLDELIVSSNIKQPELYISEIKNKKYSIRKSERTWPFEAIDDVVIIEDEDDESSNVIQAGNNVREKHRAKLLLFGDNRRPPYWGTWRKKSKSINPRRPFAKDTECFDYEVDSDEEWEEEEPGESLHGSEDEKEKDEENAEENEYDVDNDFMVPHGYLSEEEIGADEEDDDEEEGDLNPENQKKKLKIMGEQFEAERKTKTKKLKPKVIGCIWLSENNAYPESTPTFAVQFLTDRHAWVHEIPVVLTAPADADNLNDLECGTPSSKHGITSSARKAKAMEEAMPDLIRLLHYNTHGRGFLIKEFIAFWSKQKEGEKPIPKSKVQQKIQEMATRITCTEPGPMNGKACYFVKEEFRTKYLGEEKLSVPNNWTYCLTPKRKSVVVETADKIDEKEKEKEKEKKTAPLITQFTKTLTAEEMQKQLVADKVSTPTTKLPEKTLTPTTKSAENSNSMANNTSVAKATPPLNRPPKRASLISVPRGESFPKSPRVSLMDKFVTKDNSNAIDNKKDDKSKKVDLDDDDCMIIDDNDEPEVTSVISKSDFAQKVDESKNKENDKNNDDDIKVDEVDKPENISKNSDDVTVI